MRLEESQQQKGVWAANLHVCAKHREMSCAPVPTFTANSELGLCHPHITVIPHLQFCFRPRRLQNHQLCQLQHHQSLLLSPQPNHRLNPRPNLQQSCLQCYRVNLLHFLLLYHRPNPQPSYPLNHQLNRLHFPRLYHQPSYPLNRQPSYPHNSQVYYHHFLRL